MKKLSESTKKHSKINVPGSHGEFLLNVAARNRRLVLGHIAGQTVSTCHLQALPWDSKSVQPQNCLSRWRCHTTSMPGLGQHARRDGYILGYGRSSTHSKKLGATAAVFVEVLLDRTPQRV
jgi:hypothetical protein